MRITKVYVLCDDLNIWIDLNAVEANPRVDLGNNEWARKCPLRDCPTGHHPLTKLPQ